MARKEAVIMHEDHRKRVKERFLKDGIENMPDHEVLELLLFFSIPRKDTNALAHELIEHFGSLNCVLEASADDLMQVNGIGETSATLITLAFQLTKKYLKNASDKKLKKYDGPESVKELLMSKYLGAREEMVCIPQQGAFGRARSQSCQRNTCPVARRFKHHKGGRRFLSGRKCSSARPSHIYRRRHLFNGAG